MISKEKVEAVVNDWTSKGFAFTAYDVTSFLRKQGETCRHIHVNEHVKDIFTDGEMVFVDEQDACKLYDLTVKQLPNVNPPPFLYHWDQDSYDNYDQDWVENYEEEEEPESLLSGIDVDSIVPSVSVAPSTKKVSASIDGRLNIPQKFLGTTSTVDVYLSPQNDFIEVSATSPSSRGKTMCRNKDGRIRIEKGVVDSIVNRQSWSEPIFEVKQDSTGKITITQDS